MVDFYTLSILVFVLFLGIHIYTHRKNIEIKYYLLYLWRTKRFRNTIDKVAQLSPEFWKAAGTFAIFLCGLAMVFGILSVLEQDYKILSGEIKQPAAQLVFPTLAKEGSVDGGIIYIPFWFWFLTIGAILIPHEFMHGVIARAQKIKLKSVGLLLFTIFPGAFVEPEDKQVNRAPLKEKLRIFAAGSFANFLTAIIFFLLSAFLIWPAVTNSSIEMKILNVTEGSPANLAGLKANMTITEVNGKQIVPTYLEYAQTGGAFFTEEVGKIKEGNAIAFKADGETFYVKPNFENGKPRVGVFFEAPEVFKTGSENLRSVGALFQMIWLFAFAVGIFNILPIYPLDGGLMFRAVAEKYFGAGAEKIVRSVSGILILAVVFLFVGPGIVNAVGV
ncbi:MAG TPA: site-2 protease family protein [archaeon]|nr:site-2 protease family protein [archaeon]